MAGRIKDEESARIIGRNIARLLNENEMTQAELANRLGMSESAVGKWVLGKGAPRMGTVQRIADLFHVPISAIVEDYNPTRTRERQFLFDRIAKASPEDLRKLNQLLDIIEQEDENR